MLKRLIAAAFFSAAAAAQPPQVELANLREDVRGLTQRVGEMALRLEQLEREVVELRRRSAAADKSHATLAQVKEEVADLNRELRTVVASTTAETLQHVATQMEKLAQQTNAAFDSLAKAPTARSAGPTTFPDNFPKDGVSYTVQRGDTVAVIARKTGAKQPDIINANKLADPSRITVGQTLFIPGGK
jgi:LysM repeat protein